MSYLIGKFHCRENNGTLPRCIFANVSRIWGWGDAIVKGPIASVVWSVCCRCLQIFVGNFLPCCDGKCRIVAILIRFSCEDLTEGGDEGCE